MYLNFWVCVYHRIDVAPDSPVDEVDDVADTDEADRRQEEVEEVEPVIWLIGRLNYPLVKVVEYHGDI